MMRGKRITLVAGGALALIAAIGAAWLLLRTEPPPSLAEDVPVTVGGDATLDACGGVAMPVGDAVEVRAGPGMKHRVVDTLHAGHVMFVCGDAGDGIWAAVVYAPETDPERDCGVSTPIATRTAYAGSCQAGWVLATSIIVLAG